MKKLISILGIRPLHLFLIGGLMSLTTDYLIVNVGMKILGEDDKIIVESSKEITFLEGVFLVDSVIQKEKCDNGFYLTFFLETNEVISEDTVLMSFFNQIHGTQRGVSFGVFNSTMHQEGIQIGLINRVESNPSFLKILPIINF